MWLSLAAYVAAAGVLTITPGVDTALVLRSSASQGSRAGAAAAFGVCAGLFVWGAAAAFGLNALLAASATAYLTLKWAGALYLCFLGLQLLLRPRAGLAVENGASGGDLAALRRGFLTNV